MSCHRYTLQNSRCGSVDKVADYGSEDLSQHGNHTSATAYFMCLMLIKSPLKWVTGAHFWQYGGRNVIPLNGKLRLGIIYFQLLDNFVFSYTDKLFYPCLPDTEKHIVLTVFFSIL